MKDIYKKFLQNGVKQKDGSYKFTVEQLQKIYENLYKTTHNAKQDYDASVEELSNLDYRIFAAKTVIKTCKESFPDNVQKIKTPQSISKMVLTARKELKKAISKKEEVENLHANFIKPNYLSLRFETDRMRNILNWIKEQANEFGEKYNIKKDSWAYGYEFVRTTKVKFVISEPSEKKSVFVSIANMNNELVSLSNRF